MPKKLRIVLAVVAIIIVAGLAYLLTSGKDEPSTSTQTAESSESTPSNETEAPNEAAPAQPAPAPAPAPTTPNPVPAPTAAAGSYKDYSASAVASTSGTKVLFFHAPWCPQCRSLDASIKAGTIPSGVTIFKVDYDSNQKLRQQYGVTIQTTLVKLDDSGNETKKYVAYEQPNLDAVIKNLL